MKKPFSKPTAAAKTSQIRWIAISAAFAVGGIRIVFAMRGGMSFSEAVFPAGGSALGMLMGWTTYHAVSRCNNGICFFVVTPALVGKGPASFFPSLAHSLVVAVPVGFLIALTALVLRKREKRPGPAHPLYDVDVDKAATPPAAGFLPD